MPEVIRILGRRLPLFHSIHGRISLERVSIFLMWLFTVSALIGISLGYMSWFLPKTPLNLLLGFLLLLINVPLNEKKGVLVFGISFVAGMTVEIAGVATGDIFGRYTYGDNLGFKVWGVPLMIGIYWAVLVIVTSQMARKIAKSLIASAILGAALMVGLDFIMEQLASPFDFWHFEGGVAHLQNYVAWFGVAFFLQLIAFKFMNDGGVKFSSHLYFNQVAFFLISYCLLLI